MPTYKVALWVKDAGGRESREDLVVRADDRADAAREAASKVPKSLEVKKVISVEQVDE